LDDDVRLSNEPENTSGNRAIDSSSLMAFSQDFFIIFIDSKGTEKNTKNFALGQQQRLFWLSEDRIQPSF